MPSAAGSKHYAAKLNEKSVRNMRARYAKKPTRDFVSTEAEKHGVSRHTIYAVLTGRTWANVK